MLSTALILAESDSMYEGVAYRFLEHFLWIAMPWIASAKTMRGLAGAHGYW
jgi:hypothetical protein